MASSQLQFEKKRSLQNQRKNMIDKHIQRQLLAKQVRDQKKQEEAMIETIAMSRRAKRSP